MKADLHIHSILSDGSMDVTDIFHYAKRIDLDCISITDHNTTAAIAAARTLGQELDIDVIPGTEIFAQHEGTDTNVHILCYFPVAIKRLQKKLDNEMKTFNESVMKSFDAVSNKYPVTLEQVQRAAKDSNGTYYVHIAQVLADMGYTSEPIGELYSELFHAGSSYYFPKSFMTTTQAVDLIHACGGIAVLAHPGQYKNPMLMEMMLEETSLDGLELFHPRNDKKTMEIIESLGKEHDLILTGGTDFHGLYTKTPYPLGSFLCPEEGVERLKIAGEEANEAYREKQRPNPAVATEETDEDDELTEEIEVLDDMELEDIDTAEVEGEEYDS